MVKDKIAYLYQKREIDPSAVPKMKKTAALFSSRETWYPSRREAGKEPLELPARKRIVRSVVINPKRFLEEDGLLEIYIPGFGSDERASFLPVATLQFEDGELIISWLTESGGYEQVTVPRDKMRVGKTPTGADVS